MIGLQKPCSMTGEQGDFQATPDTSHILIRPFPLPKRQLLLTIYKSMCIVSLEDLEEQYASQTISSFIRELAARED